ncbi:MAG: hypothetical protein RMJ67_09910 [Elusimicrobiota bacterium]|nr:hypothetical protein [Endomicrobiia bacterium]MDW8166809.1 hypothetical protein [Elusimicrobiota bacterium]
MKGEINPIIYAVLAIVVVVALIAMFILRVGPFSEELNEVTCSGYVSEACSKYSLRGNLNVFTGIPDGCSRFYPNLQGCKEAAKQTGGTTQDNPCDNLCRG